jgi:hypothetical protein
MAMRQSFAHAAQPVLRYRAMIELLPRAASTLGPQPLQAPLDLPVDRRKSVERPARSNSRTRIEIDLVEDPPTRDGDDDALHQNVIEIDLA